MFGSATWRWGERLSIIRRHEIDPCLGGQLAKPLESQAADPPGQPSRYGEQHADNDDDGGAHLKGLGNLHLRELSLLSMEIPSPVLGLDGRSRRGVAGGHMDVSV